MTFIKVCGLTQEEDVTAAIAAGADYLGFIHVEKSPRFVDTDRLRGLLEVAAGSGAQRVIVVQNADPETLDQLRNTLSFEWFQFHGDEPESFLQRWRGYRVFHMKQQTTAADLQTFGHPFLLDTQVGSAKGGTGKTFDWSILPQVEGRYFVAGGLVPENVADLVRTYRPWGVDVSSGVETRPGSKDHDKLKLFIDNVRSAGAL